ncbi:MAG: magnesium transporter [Lactobacillaceae bacterium]|jgi:magnesium transporter|nr:magnesium transporter [Lactobacillaceae bacterium]
MNEIDNDLDLQFKWLQDALDNDNQELFLSRFDELHGYEKAQYYLSLDKEQRELVITFLDGQRLAEIFDDINETEADFHELLKEIPARKAAAMFNEMYTDNSVDILETLSPSELSTYLSLMPKADAQEIRELLNYDDYTAGSLMGTDFISVSENIEIGSAMKIVKQRANDAEQITYVYVVNSSDILVGVISLRSLIVESDNKKVSDFMNTNLITVEPDTDQEEVARIMQDYNFVALPVVVRGELIGVITVDDIVDVIQEEADDDYSRLAGVDVTAEDTPIISALKRLPWLIGLIFLGLGTASVINGFDHLISQVSVLAVFVSLITGTAGNAGTQSLAVSVRKIALDESSGFLKTLLIEILIGLIVGIASGFVIFLIVIVWKTNMMLAVAVGIAMGVAILVANVAGAFIPQFMNKIGVDPAIASGPFISTMSDLTSVLIYFNIASLFLQHFS